jgi:hypothetical protein
MESHVTLREDLSKLRWELYNPPAPSLGIIIVVFGLCRVVAAR